jgi:hypothetical protein
LASEVGYLVGFTPTMASVLLATDNTAYVKFVSVKVVMGWGAMICYYIIYLYKNKWNKINGDKINGDKINAEC